MHTEYCELERWNNGIQKNIPHINWSESPLQLQDQRSKKRNFQSNVHTKFAFQLRAPTTLYAYKVSSRIEQPKRVCVKWRNQIMEFHVQD